jgi:hypothetical protein
MMIEPKYYTNPGDMCIGISLANLFLYVQDFETAKKIMADYSKSPLVKDDFTVHYSVTTRLVHDLTDGEYKARLHTNLVNENLHGNLNHHYPGKADSLIEIVEEETAAERIVEIKNGACRVFHPSMYLICFDIDESAYSHALVVLPNGDAIDDGYVMPFKEIKQKPIFRSILGILEITNLKEVLFRKRFKLSLN